MTILKQIQKILDYVDYTDLKSLQLKEIQLNDYKILLEKKLKDISTSPYQLKDSDLLATLIFEITKQRTEEREELEIIHYELLLEWVKSIQASTPISFICGQIIVNILSKVISHEKLNYYDETLQTSILKETLNRVENILTFQILIDNGLEIKDIEGLNPYYYALKNSTSTNTMIQLLEKNGVLFPDKYWSYVFNEIMLERLTKDRNYLLKLKDKEFIVDNETQECVWNKIIQKGKYDLIEYIPEEFYKPHKIENKSLVDDMISSIKNFEIVVHLKEKIFKLVDKKEELYPLWNSIIKNEQYYLIEYIPEDFYTSYKLENKILIEDIIKNKNLEVINKYKEKIFQLVDKPEEFYKLWDECLKDDTYDLKFIKNFYGVFSNVFKKIEDKKYKDLRHKFEYLEKKIKNNSLNKILKSIAIYQYENQEIIDKFPYYEGYATISELNKFYKTRRDAPKVLRDEILGYLKSFPGFQESAPRQCDDVEQGYVMQFNILREENKRNIFKDNIGFNDHFEGYVKQLNERQFNLLNDAIEMVHENMFYLITPVNPLKEKAEESIVVENKNNISVQLFSKDNFDKLKKENTDNSTVLTNFFKKVGTIKPYQHKTLATALTLLDNIEILYETFPHFKEVIKHIENFMILQEKGDKSFYLPPLLLGGSPGVGKTFFCHTISKLVSTHFELLNMESMTANWVLTGASAQWKDATPGKIFKSLFNEENKNMNPIFLLDELEKAGNDSRYGVMNSLLPLLERFTAKKFKDECIPLEIDASYIVWLATANDIEKLTAPIRSRFDIISVPNPTPSERKSLIKGIYRAVRENNSWGNYFEEALPQESLDILSNLMAPGAARDLRKSITLACSTAIREQSKIILPNHIERYENGEIMPWDMSN